MSIAMKTFLDWSAYDTYGVGDAYAGIPATGGNYAKAVAVCMNNHQCQRDGKGVMCPSYRITHDPAHSTGARVKAFKAALNGELGDEPFAHPDLAAAMDLCVSCKGCKKECPSAVDMTLIKTEYLAHRNACRGLSPRSRLFGGLPQWLHRWPVALAWLVRWRNASPLVARLAERWLGISARRPIPEIVDRPIGVPNPECYGQRKKVAIFVDTFTHYYTPEVAEAAIKPCCTAGGYSVEVLRPAADDGEPERPLCAVAGPTCRKAWSMPPSWKAQTGDGRAGPALAEGTPIVGLEPSCLLALARRVLQPVARAGGRAARQAGFPVRGIPDARGQQGAEARSEADARRQGRGPWPLPPEGLRRDEVDEKGARLDTGIRVRDRRCQLLRHVRQLRAGGRALRGLGGKMGELALLPAVRAAPADAPIVADGFSCRHQIKDGTGRDAVHVAVLLAAGAGLGGQVGRKRAGRGRWPGRPGSARCIPACSWAWRFWRGKCRRSGRGPGGSVADHPSRL
jgi:glycerol-3-phosphate dehydrogenase subunit C